MLSKATKRPWHSQIIIKTGGESEFFIHQENAPLFKNNSRNYLDLDKLSNAVDLVAESRNVLPEILECLESALKYAMDHKKHCDHNKIDYSEEQMEFLKKVGIE